MTVHELWNALIILVFKMSLAITPNPSNPYLLVKKGVFPEDLKMPHVTPIYKGKDSSDVSNYKYLCSHAFPKYLSA